MGLRDYVERWLADWKREHPDEPLSVADVPRVMNRRKFLFLGAAAVAATALPLPSLALRADAFELVSAPLSVGNTFITPAWVTQEVARHWENNLKLVQKFVRDIDREYDRAWTGARL